MTPFDTQYDSPTLAPEGEDGEALVADLDGSGNIVEILPATGFAPSGGEAYVPAHADPAVFFGLNSTETVILLGIAVIVLTSVYYLVKIRLEVARGRDDGNSRSDG